MLQLAPCGVFLYDEKVPCSENTRFNFWVEVAQKVSLVINLKSHTIKFQQNIFQLLPESIQFSKCKIGEQLWSLMSRIFSVFFCVSQKVFSFPDAL